MAAATPITPMPIPMPLNARPWPMAMTAGAATTRMATDGTQRISRPTPKIRKFRSQAGIGWDGIWTTIG